MTSPLAYVGFTLSGENDSENIGDTRKFQLSSFKVHKENNGKKPVSVCSFDSLSDSSADEKSNQDADFNIEIMERVHKCTDVSSSSTAPIVSVDDHGTDHRADLNAEVVEPGSIENCINTEVSVSGIKRSAENIDSDAEVTQPKQVSLQHQTFVDYDFSKALNKCPCPDFEQAPIMKRYRVKLKQGSEVQVVRLYKEKSDKILQNLSLKFKFPKHSGTRLHYPLRLSDGKPEIMTIVSWDTDLKQSLEDFYSQTDAMCLLEVEACEKPGKRDKRPNEIENENVKLHGTTDRSIYKLLQDSPEVAEIFLQKQKYIATLLGDEEAVNLLSISFYLCHIQSCQRVIKLKSFSNCSSIIDHWKIHATAVNLDPSCDMLVRKNNFICQKGNKKHPWKTHITVEELDAKRQ